ncbi:MAG TPA: DUF2550 family protein, partial [Nocardioidaceae bacterium]|nr:DUF2550 family protein [Nocardioidaceae bacterium]
MVGVASRRSRGLAAACPALRHRPCRAPSLDLPRRRDLRVQRPRPVRQGRRGWVLGIGRYSGDALEWFRIFSL